MNIKDISSAYPSADLMAAIAAARTLPERKRDVIVRDTMEKLEKQRKQHTMIRQNVCPICSGKLNRGKKDRNNNYKRKWACTVCKSEYTI